MRKIVALLSAVLVMSLLSSVYALDDCNVVRYVDNLDGTMTDCRSNLIWLKDANCKDTSNAVPKGDGHLTWKNAMKWVAGLHNGLCGLSDVSNAGDWRLPTKTEFMAMIISAKKQGFHDPVFTNYQGTGNWGVPTVQSYDFQNVLTDTYWSSTTVAYDTTGAWALVMFAEGIMANGYKVSSFYVWPVRGGQSGSFGTLRIE
jgi:hypothetical protein